jgi:hypothetical protein
MKQAATLKQKFSIYLTSFLQSFSRTLLGLLVRQLQLNYLSLIDLYGLNQAHGDKQPRCTLPFTVRLTRGITDPLMVPTPPICNRFGVLHGADGILWGSWIFRFVVSV